MVTMKNTAISHSIGTAIAVYFLLILLASNNTGNTLQIPGEKQMEQLRRQVRDEVEKPLRDLLDAANNDAERYRVDYNRASRELVVVRAELDQLRTEHCRNVAELKMRLETEVSISPTRLVCELD